MLNDRPSGALIATTACTDSADVMRPCLSSTGTNGVVRLTFAEPQERIGYGFLINNFPICCNATTIALVDVSGMRFNHVLTGTRKPDLPAPGAGERPVVSPVAPSSTNLTTPSSLPTRPRL